ncbi:sigma-70 family RNA polymerase sigma factor [Pedococcus sp. 5OH_020]|uniref:sigma-70 family RNA polymerase sigma factor n=1 Tax=Pedococcus sp. 5OH_020 TaxID=2989814 RepID=UPI0022E9D494|nr:sigma-70 family RNA polymerase sigma factor [Pedococcus sp. 5OH_020]
MSTVDRDEARSTRAVTQVAETPLESSAAVPPTAPTGAPGRSRDWVVALTTPGHEQTVALRELHRLMLKAAAHQVWRMRAALPDASPGTVEDIANQAADDAMTALLGKLHTFEGRSRFTTWAFKFAILEAACEVRRLQWQHREVELRDFDVAAGNHDSPERHAEGSDLAQALVAAMRSVLTPHQRRVAIALLVDGVPIDVLADRLGTTRGALYKTVHDTRTRLRTELSARGYLTATAPTTSAGPA